jgi:hypothetical protein
MLRFLKFGVIGLAGILAVTYGIDWAGVAFPGARQLYADLRVDHVYTSTNKWKQVEYSRGLPTTERCVNALFSHGGYRPCWYVRSHTMDVVNTD